MKAIIKAVRSGNKKGEFRFVIVADNNEIIATSETYTQKHNVIDILKYISDFKITEVLDETVKPKK